MAEIVDPKGRNPSQFRHTPEPLPEVPGVRPFELPRNRGLGLARKARTASGVISRALFLSSRASTRGVLYSNLLRVRLP